MSTTDVRATTDFDHHAPELAPDPFPAYAELREKCPVAFSEQWGGFWVVTGAAEVIAVAKDDDTFCSGQGVSLPTIGQARPLLPIESDAPRFRVYRQALDPLFSPKAAERLEGDIREIVTELIDDFVERGSVDFISELGQIIPARLTLRMLGLDEQAWPWFLERIHIGVHESAHDLDTSVDALIEVYAAIAEGLEDRYDRGEPGPDVISHLAYFEHEGERFSEEEVLDICLLLLFGGLDTTASLIGRALLHLGRNPEHRDRLAADPSRVPLAISEYLRFETPVQALARTCTRDTVLGGQHIRAGEKLWVVWASANRDAVAFENPDVIDIDRNPNRHIAFGVGIHRCLGSNVARSMANVTVREVLARIPDFHVPEGVELPRFHDSSVVYGLTSLPAVFTPGKPSGASS
jgi:cytochrome P450